MLLECRDMVDLVQFRKNCKNPEPQSRIWTETVISSKNSQKWPGMVKATLLLGPIHCSQARKPQSEAKPPASLF